MKSLMLTPGLDDPKDKESGQRILYGLIAVLGIVIFLVIFVRIALMNSSSCCLCCYTTGDQQNTRVIYLFKISVYLILRSVFRKQIDNDNEMPCRCTWSVVNADNIACEYGEVAECVVKISFLITTIFKKNLNIRVKVKGSLSY